MLFESRKILVRFLLKLQPVHFTGYYDSNATISRFVVVV